MGDGEVFGGAVWARLMGCAIRRRWLGKGFLGRIGGGVEAEKVVGGNFKRITDFNDVACLRLAFALYPCVDGVVMDANLLCKFSLGYSL